MAGGKGASGEGQVLFLVRGLGVLAMEGPCQDHGCCQRLSAPGGAIDKGPEEGLEGVKLAGAALPGCEGRGDVWSPRQPLGAGAVSSPQSQCRGGDLLVPLHARAVC